MVCGLVLIFAISRLVMALVAPVSGSVLNQELNHSNQRQSDEAQRQHAGHPVGRTVLRADAFDAAGYCRQAAPASDEYEKQGEAEDQDGEIAPVDLHKA